MRGYAALLARLLALDSANPATCPGGPGEAEVARACAAWVGDFGIGSELIGCRGDRRRLSLVATSRGGPPGPRLLLVGHLDTHGRAGGGSGAYDMKAGVAAILLAVAATARRGHRGEVVAVLVADEEHESAGLASVRSHLHGAAAVVGEGTGLGVGVRHDGHLRVDAPVGERRPEVLLRLAAALRDRADLRRGLTVAWPAGGVTLRRRIAPGEDATAMAHALQERISGVLGATEARVRLPLHGASPGASALAALTRDAAAAVGLDAAAGDAGGWTEAAALEALGIPTVVFGPPGGGAHTPDEWVDVPAAARASDVLAGLALRATGSR